MDKKPQNSRYSDLAFSLKKQTFKDLIVSMTAPIMLHQAEMQSHNPLGDVLTTQANLPLIGELTPL